MPNHIHLIVYFPDGSKRADFMRDFKKYTSTQIRKEIEAVNTKYFEQIRYEKGKQLFKIWQDRFDELYLVSRKLLEEKLNYIHLNPLQEHWSLVKEPKDYEYSSAGYYETGEQRVIFVSHYLDFV